jgi:hypothetical protein
MRDRSERTERSCGLFRDLFFFLAGDKDARHQQLHPSGEQASFKRFNPQVRKSYRVLLIWACWKTKKKCLQIIPNVY